MTVIGCAVRQQRPLPAQRPPSTRLMPIVSPELRYPPLAQSIWYIPTGLDPWNQLLGKAPGHYARQFEVSIADARAPGLLAGSGPAAMRWFIQRRPQRVADARAARRSPALVSTLSGPASRRAESAAAAGTSWPLPDGSTCRTGCSTTVLTPPVTSRTAPAPRSSSVHSSAGTTRTASCTQVCPTWPPARAGTRRTRWPANVTAEAFEGRDHDLPQNNGGLSQTEAQGLVDALLQSDEPAWTTQLTSLLKSAKGPGEIIDTIQLAAAETILGTHDPRNFSMPQHAYEYSTRCAGSTTPSTIPTR